MPYNFLQDFHVKFGETVKKYFDVRKGDTDGFFVVTDKRFVWQKKGALHPEVRVHSGLLPESSKTTAVVLFLCHASTLPAPSLVPRTTAFLVLILPQVEIPALDLKHRPRKVTTQTAMKMTVSAASRNKKSVCMSTRLPVVFVSA